MAQVIHGRPDPRAGQVAEHEQVEREEQEDERQPAEARTEPEDRCGDEHAGAAKTLCSYRVCHDELSIEQRPVAAQNKHR